MSKTDDLKQIAQLRKAIIPIVQKMNDESSAKTYEQLAVLGDILKQIVAKETVVNYQPADITVEPPVVTIQPPEVNVTVTIPDELTKSIQKMAEPVINTPVDPPSAYEPHDQAKKGVYQYSGFARSDGAYYIQRVAKGEQRYAKGTGDYVSAWEKRGDLKYGYIDGVK